MSQAFGPLPRPRTRGIKYVTLGILFGIISILSGLLTVAIAQAAVASLTLNLAVTAIAAVGSLACSVWAKARHERHSTSALLISGFAALLTVITVVV